MSIRHAILGLLADEPMHGYGLKKVFDRRMSPLWGLTTGQIYQSLAGLERAALVESRTDRRRRRSVRRTYSITAAGRRELAEWLRAKPAAWSGAFREDILLRLMVLRGEEATSVLHWIGQQTQEARALLVRTSHLSRERSGHRDPLDVGRIFLEGLAMRLESDLKSLERLRSAIETWATERGLGATPDDVSRGTEGLASVSPARVSRPSGAPSTLASRVSASMQA